MRAQGALVLLQPSTVEAELLISALGLAPLQHARLAARERWRPRRRVLRRRRHAVQQHVAPQLRRSCLLRDRATGRGVASAAPLACACTHAQAWLRTRGGGRGGGGVRVMERQQQQQQMDSAASAAAISASGASPCSSGRQSAVLLPSRESAPAGVRFAGIIPRACASYRAAHHADARAGGGRCALGPASLGMAGAAPSQLTTGLASPRPVQRNRRHRRVVTGRRCCRCAR